MRTLVIVLAMWFALFMVLPSKADEPHWKKMIFVGDSIESPGSNRNTNADGYIECHSRWAADKHKGLTEEERWELDRRKCHLIISYETGAMKR